MDKRSYEELADLLTKARMQVVPGSKWQHYKGGQYTIVELAILEETQEVVVLYRPLRHLDVPFVRPLAVWQETVEWQGKTVPRFRLMN